MARTVFVPVDPDRIHRMYADGLSPAAIAQSIGAKEAAVYYFLKKNGVAMRDRSASHRKHAVNHEYFASVTTPEQAYWLGFLAADGSVQPRGTVTLTLAIQDMAQVEAFNTAVQSSYPVRRVVTLSSFGSYEAARLDIHSPRMVETLAAHGVVPNKTRHGTPPALAPALMPHFWRGAFDGNGAICRPSSRPCAWSVAFCGNLAMVTAFRDFALGLFASSAAIRKCPGMYDVRFANRMAEKLLRALYTDGHHALERKLALVRLVYDARRVIGKGGRPRKTPMPK